MRASGRAGGNPRSAARRMADRTPPGRGGPARDARAVAARRRNRAARAAGGMGGSRDGTGGGRRGGRALSYAGAAPARLCRARPAARVQHGVAASAAERACASSRPGPASGRDAVRPGQAEACPHARQPVARAVTVPCAVSAAAFAVSAFAVSLPVPVPVGRQSGRVRHPPGHPRVRAARLAVTDGITGRAPPPRQMSSRSSAAARGVRPPAHASCGQARSSRAPRPGAAPASRRCAAASGRQTSAGSRLPRPG